MNSSISRNNKQIKQVIKLLKTQIHKIIINNKKKNIKSKDQK